MFALLFDRRSLIVTGVALAGVASLLFAAGLVTGLTLQRERVVVPPYWLKYGPVETSDVRATESGRSPSRPATAGTASGAPPAAPPDSVSPAPATGDAAGGEPSVPPDWVPFAKPGDPTPSQGAPPEGGVRAKPPGGVTQGGATPGGVTQGGAEQDGTGQGGAKQDAGTITPQPPATGAGGSGAVEADPPAPGPATGTEVPPATTQRADLDCPEPGQPTWYVQTGAYAVATNAEVRHDSLQARFAAGGPRAYLSKTTNRAGVELTLVRLGPFTTRQAARRAAAALDDAFVGMEAGGSAEGCGDGSGEVAGRRQAPGNGGGTVALAARVSPAG